MRDRDYVRWHSPALGREMELLVFGHAGARMLVFPTSMGRFYEWEDRGMVAALGDQIRRGDLQLFCVDSVDGESWYDRGKPVRDRVARHEQYERYLLEELLPYSVHRNGNPYLIVAGASFGGYHAMNLGLRHPTRVDRVVGLSGLYDIKQVGGPVDEAAVYFHDPSHYMLHEEDPHRLDRLRDLDIILAVGREDAAFPDNEHLSGVLWAKGIWHAYRPWDGWAHDWPWWREMIRAYAGGAG